MYCLPNSALGMGLSAELAVSGFTAQEKNEPFCGVECVRQQLRSGEVQAVIHCPDPDNVYLVVYFADKENNLVTQELEISGVEDAQRIISLQVLELLRAICEMPGLNKNATPQPSQTVADNSRQDKKMSVPPPKTSQPIGLSAGIGIGPAWIDSSHSPGFNGVINVLFELRKLLRFQILGAFPIVSSKFGDITDARLYTGFAGGSVGAGQILKRFEWVVLGGYTAFILSTRTASFQTLYTQNDYRILSGVGLNGGVMFYFNKHAGLQLQFCVNYLLNKVTYRMGGKSIFNSSPFVLSTFLGLTFKLGRIQS